MVSPVADILSVVHPLFLTSHEWLWWWVSWATNSTETVECWSFSFEIRVKLECRPVWDPGIGNSHLVLSPVADILSIIHPLLLASHKWLWGWVGWATNSTETVESNSLSSSLKSRGIWNSSICNLHLMVTPVVDILSIIHPLLLTSHKWLWRWVGWSHSTTQTIWRFKLSGRLIWNSSVSNFNLMVTPVINILSIIHPLLLASDKWLWRWVGWATCTTESIWSWSLN